MVKKLLFATILVCVANQTYAQTAETAEIMEVFNTFFDAMKNRDTLKLKAITMVLPSNEYFITISSDDRGNTGLNLAHATFKGFLNAVGTSNSHYGLCTYQFENHIVNIFERFATVKVDFKCFTSSDKPENCGIYNFQMLNTDEWKVRQVIRYVLKECK